MKMIFAVPVIVAAFGYSVPSHALQSCELKVDGASVTFAGRGDDFYDKTVNKWDDGDTCRSQGRKYGPNECRDISGTTFTTIAVKNNGTKKVWDEVCN